MLFHRKKKFSTLQNYYVRTLNLSSRFNKASTWIDLNFAGILFCRDTVDKNALE